MASGRSSIRCSRRHSAEPSATEWAPSAAPTPITIAQPEAGITLILNELQAASLRPNIPLHFQRRGRWRRLPSETLPLTSIPDLSPSSLAAPRDVHRPRMGAPSSKAPWRARSGEESGPSSCTVPAAWDWRWEEEGGAYRGRSGSFSGEGRGPRPGASLGRTSAWSLDSCSRGAMARGAHRVSNLRGRGAQASTPNRRFGRRGSRLHSCRDR